MLFSFINHWSEKRWLLMALQEFLTFYGGVFSSSEFPRGKIILSSQEHFGFLGGDVCEFP